MGEPSAMPTHLAPTHMRYGVLGFVCTLSLITYLDRVCIMRVKDNIQEDLGLTPVMMGLVFSSFLVGYALFEVPAGWMGDTWGSRRVLTRIVLWWSVFTALTGAVWHFSLDSGWTLFSVPLLFDSFLAILLVRFLFGCGEAGAYPNMARVTGTWFPYRERALAQGTVWMSARLGAAIAPLVIGKLTTYFGWRQAFWILGGLGLAWAILFFRWYRDTPEEMPACNQAERDLIHEGPYSLKVGEAGPAHASPPWVQMLALPSLYALCLVSAAVSFGWYFYPTWQPEYLKEVHGIQPENSEIATGLPFLFGAAGALVGGWLSDWMVRVTGSRRWGRSLLSAAGFTVAGLCVFSSGFVTTPWPATILFCLALFFNDIGIPPIWAACADIGGRYSGTLSAIMNMAGGIGSISSPILIPVILKALPADYSPQERWQIIFFMLSAAWFIGAAAWLGINAARPLEGARGEGMTNDQ